MVNGPKCMTSCTIGPPGNLVEDMSGALVSIDPSRDAVNTTYCESCGVLVVAGKGRGVVVTQNVKAGTLLAVGRPLDVDQVPTLAQSQAVWDLMTRALLLCAA